MGPELASVKKLTTKQEKILAARRHYSGGDYANKLVLLCGHGYPRTERQAGYREGGAVRSAAECDCGHPGSHRGQDDGSEALSEEHVITLPAKDLPRYGNLRVRFSDATGHALDDMDVALER